MIFYDVYRNNKFQDVEYAEGTDWKGIVCPKYDDHQRAGERIGDLKIKINNKVGDFLWTFLSETIVSDRVADLLSDNKITGYDLKEVEVINLASPLKLWELKVIGDGGEAHNDSGIKLIEKCEYCSKVRYSPYKNGIIININNWDGSDIFCIVGYPRHILVTERVKVLLEKNKITGVKYTPSHELKWPEGLVPL